MNSFELRVLLFQLLCPIIKSGLIDYCCLGGCWPFGAHRAPCTIQEGYPPLVVNTEFSEPAINLKLFSTYDNDKAPAYVSSNNKNGKSLFYFLCPLQTNNEGENILIYREKYKNDIFLDEPTPVTCESPVRGIFKNLRSFDDNTEYQMGLHVYKKIIKSKNENIIIVDPNDSYIIHMLNFTFNYESKMIISASYQINAPSFMSIGSNHKTIIPYDKNLNPQLDEQYEYFKTVVIPRMLEKIDDSLLKKFCDDNNITSEQCIAEIESVEFAQFKKYHSDEMRQRIACNLGVQKVQLVPKDDFITDAKKTATYADVLTIPIWKVFLFKWNTVEIFLPKLAKVTGNLKVQTGVSGTVENVEEHYTKDDHSHKQLHVPEYIWKIIYGTINDSQNAMLIVMINNPFGSYGCAMYSPNVIDCIERGWPIESGDIHTGKICCFKVNEEIKKKLNIVTELKEYGLFDVFYKYLGKHKLPYDVSNARERIYDWGFKCR